MFKKIISYFYPINLHKTTSEISKSLEVTLVNGQVVLDSLNTNYSYGSLQRVLRKGLLSIGFDNIKPMNHILVLGVAGGSVIKTLVDEIGYSGKITGIELDEKVIDLANEHFGLDKIKNLNIIHHEAFEFVLKTKLKYDLIIVDIFQDTTMPGFLFENFFQNRLTEILNVKGYILFNTMILKEHDNARNTAYLSFFDIEKYKVWTLPRIEEHNELILVRKENNLVH
ncbi:MAG TPA: fused MFS/spermidine synthase [Flavobacterium sp.]|uniref:spermidine synthase n=1 Tax=unclassified Flavobacterium TaxID=196869 RepID=UPI0025C04AD2|nr:MULTISPECIES: fused MFS/spermidine synthase [unclassified Flavobacterium]HRE76695.1 fused MFS/spermidine synthase [Flavobacterium sp.]